MQNPVAMSHTFDTGDDLFAPGMKRLSIRAIAVNRRRQTLAASTLQQYGSRFRDSLWEILNLKPQSPEGQQFFRHYLTIEKHLLLFLDNETVPPTNYSSEQALRWSVVFCKVTHGFCSDWGAELFAQVRSLVNTARHQSISAFQAISHALASHQSDWLLS
jgi:transposase